MLIFMQIPAHYFPEADDKMGLVHVECDLIGACWPVICQSPISKRIRLYLRATTEWLGERLSGRVLQIGCHTILLITKICAW